MPLLYKIIAEAIGTFALVFIGSGSIILSEKHILPSIYIPIVWGFMVFIMIILMGHVSGAHFNPAVTAAFALAKRIPLELMFLYWSSQLVGGLAATALLGFLNK